MSCLRIVKNISMVLVVAVAVSLAGCADGDMATVRININLPETARVAYIPSLLDRIFTFITLSQPAIAEPPPTGGDYTVNSIVIDVSGLGMVPITETIDASTGFIEIEIPAGNDRIITIRAYDDDPGWVGSRYGNEMNVNLTPGQTLTLQPLMIHTPVIDYAVKDSSLEIWWIIPSEPPYTFELQSSTSLSSSFTTFFPGLGQVSGFEYYEENSPILENHYVRVRAIYEDQKGVFSEPYKVDKPN